MDDSINPWKINHSKQIYSNNWISLTEHAITNPVGKPGIYGVVQFKNIAVGVLPVDEHYNIWLVGQYRFPLQQYSWEIPEGGASMGEDTLVAAARELEEETGLRATRYTKLVEMHLSNSVSDEYAIVYIAQGLSQHQPMPEETEQLLIKKLPFEAAYEMVENGEITDSMSVAAILKAKLMMLQGKF